VNVSGCLLVGALVALLEIRPVHRLARPFLGVGVLGGYTTFSAYTVEGRLLVSDGGPLVALLYVVGTLGAALLAVPLGGALTRAVVRPDGGHDEAAA
jgi:CrcB protein